MRQGDALTDCRGHHLLPLKQRSADGIRVRAFRYGDRVHHVVYDFLDGLSHNPVMNVPLFDQVDERDRPVRQSEVQYFVRYGDVISQYPLVHFGLVEIVLVLDLV